MGNNGHMGQLVGPFKAKENLYFQIEKDAKGTILYVEHLGIQAGISDIVYINGAPYEIGKTGIYEVGNTEITSIYFEKDTNEYAIVDYIVHFDEAIN